VLKAVGGVMGEVMADTGLSKDHFVSKFLTAQRTGKAEKALEEMVAANPKVSVAQLARRLRDDPVLLDSWATDVLIDWAKKQRN
jgi:hypothetical protein